jgi:hypothetical protein
MSSPNGPSSPGESIQEALNPHRREEQARAAAHTRDVLVQRGVRVSDADDPDRLASILEAVERFEGVVRARGGDSFLNSPRSSEPENPDWVIPVRGEGESAEAYIHRIDEAIGRLRSA